MIPTNLRSDHRSESHKICHRRSGEFGPSDDDSDPTGGTGIPAPAVSGQQSPSLAVSDRTNYDCLRLTDRQSSSQRVRL